VTSEWTAHTSDESAGWLPQARAVPSPNFDLRKDAADVSLLVLHSISLPPGAYGGDAIERLFTNTLAWDAHPYFEGLRGLRVSAHFVIRRSGELLQFVSCEHRAWHAGQSTWRGQTDCNSWSIGVELEGLEDEPFEAIQYAALETLTGALSSQYPLRSIAGHEHIAPGRKRDPGAAFDWLRIRGWPALRGWDGPWNGRQSG
jgi:AmpD protein